MAITDIELSDEEIVAETFQAIRVHDLKRAEQVKSLMTELFPEISQERRDTCLVKLATIVVEANQEVLSPGQQQQWRGLRR